MRGEDALDTLEDAKVGVLEFVSAGNRCLARIGGIPRAEMAERLNFTRRQGVKKVDVIGERLLTANGPEGKGVDGKAQRLAFFSSDFEESVVGKHFAHAGG